MSTFQAKGNEIVVPGTFAMTSNRICDVESLHGSGHDAPYDGSVGCHLNAINPLLSALTIVLETSCPLTVN